MNIVEVIKGDGVITTSGELNVSKRFQTPRPGDPVIFESKEYPFNSSPYGRIDSSIYYEKGKISLCCGGASVFLGNNGEVSISGGPFESVRAIDLEPQLRLMKVDFWNWGENSPGADQGVHYTIERPLFLLKKKRLVTKQGANLIQVNKAKWNRISKDYKGSNNKKGERSVFGGCIEKKGGTKLYLEGVHFIIID